MSSFSLNNRFIVEPYVTDRGLKATERNGFAMITQKISLKGLRLLVDAQLTGFGQQSTAYDGISASGPLRVPAGSLIYIREELLHTQIWAQKPLECDSIEGKFIIVDASNVEFVKLP